MVRLQILQKSKQVALLAINERLTRHAIQSNREGSQNGKVLSSSLQKLQQHAQVFFMDRQAPTERQMASLDGIRGIAALIVIFSHAVFWYYPAAHLGLRTQGRPTDGIDVFNSPFTFFFRGGFSVSLFFVLSGIVLTYSILKHENVINAALNAAKRRYIRIGIPVAVSIMICYLLIKIGVYGENQILPTPFLSTKYLFNPSILEALQDSLFGALILGHSKYNYTLWTIQIELLGSFIIYALLIALGKHTVSLRLVCISIAFSVPLYSNTPMAIYLSMFMIGTFIATFETPNLNKVSACALGSILVITGLYLAGFNPGSQAYTLLTTKIIAWARSIGARPSWYIVVPYIGATMITIGVMTISEHVQIMNLRVFKWLGKLSFSVYLLHSFALAIVCPIAINTFGVSIISLAATIIATTIITLIASIYFHRYVDYPSIKLASIFSKKISNSRPRITAST